MWKSPLLQNTYTNQIVSWRKSTPTMTTATFAFSPATATSPLINRTSATSSSVLKSSSQPSSLDSGYWSRGVRTISCRVASTSPSIEAVSASADAEEKEDEVNAKKVGARVRVKVPLKVYHVPRVPEIDLTGMEGVLKVYVGLWKGKRISANLPYKIEFVKEIEGRGPVKFAAHLREDEFEYLE